MEIKATKSEQQSQNERSKHLTQQLEMGREFPRQRAEVCLVEAIDYCRREKDRMGVQEALVLKGQVKEEIVM